MTKIEWHRRTTWTAQDRDEFYARLKRSRSDYNKAQYLRLQAFHLAQVGLHAAAIELLDLMLTDFPNEFELAMAHLQKGRSLGALDLTAPAIDEYRAALQAERDYPTVKTGAWLHFALFVVEKNLVDLYGEISQILVEFRGARGLTFPFIEFKYWAARSIIADFNGEPMDAREFAKRVLAEASKEHSGLRYHAKVGLVGSDLKQIERRLKAIAGDNWFRATSRFFGGTDGGNTPQP